ncbi:mesothelin-like protein [Phodopus roborovskii]|uniref:Mslnl protein n=1 Tax=Phodopus roborovskii TaxID=109678 RepID=A0AAU9Z2Y2_PHORO|nr:mesothelin-like protein [Phodopus roborovskii]CAH6786601.1 Mslnl [Phodopus roborovskii]
MIRTVRQSSALGSRLGALVSPGLILLLVLTAHCSGPQMKGFPEGEPTASEANTWIRNNTSLLQNFRCLPASQLPREELSTLLRSLASQRTPLKAWQLSCLANLAARQGLQDDFKFHPPNLLLFYNLSQVSEANCRAFIHHAAQGDTELLANLPNQRVALQHTALSCLGRPHLQLSASDLGLLGVLACDMEAPQILTSDPHVLKNLLRCPRLTVMQTTALNTLLASGKTQIGPPDSWNLEGLQALGPLATYISPHLWEKVQEAVGLDFFRSVVAAYRAARLSRHDAMRFITNFLESKANSVSSRLKRRTGSTCVRGNITAATLHDDLFLVHYDCTQLESCLGTRVLRANLDPLLQHPLPAECQRVVKAKLAQIYPHGIPEDQLHLITSLVYLYSLDEIGQWNITSGDTVMVLLASDAALENQTEAVLQKYLDHNGKVTGALLVAIGGSRLCWMSLKQIQIIQPSEFRLAGAPDISPCPQSRKDVLFAKAREVFRNTSTVGEYYYLIRPYLGGAPLEELQYLAQANISMDIDTFTNLNPLTLKNMSVDNVRNLLGQNVGDLQKARNHPNVILWMHSHNMSDLSEMGLDTSPTLSYVTNKPPNTVYPPSNLIDTLNLPGNDGIAPASGSPPVLLGCLSLAVALPSSLLWLLLGQAPSGPIGTAHRALGPWTLPTVLTQSSQTPEHQIQEQQSC